MRTSVLVGAVLVLAMAARAEAQRLDGLVVGARVLHEAVPHGDRDMRGLQKALRGGGGLLTERLIWSALAGTAVALPFAYLSMMQEGTTGLWFGGGAYILTTAAVAASHRSATNKCTSDERFVRSLLGAVAGAGVAAAIATTLDDSNRSGVRAAIAGTGAFFATPLGASLAVSGCD